MGPLPAWCPSLMTWVFPPKDWALGQVPLSSLATSCPGGEASQETTPGPPFC